MTKEENLDWDRRNDLGYKQTMALFVAVLTIIVGLFVHASWKTAHQGIVDAKEARNMAENNRVTIAELKSMANDIEEIKQLLKRRLPI